MEIWVDIPGFENYQATYEGKIKYKGGSQDIKNRWGGITNRTKKEHILKPWIKHHNYCCITIIKDGKRKALSVQRIIAGCFLGLDMSNTKIEVGHKDNNPLNNHGDNLYLTTHIENEAYKLRCGRTTRGEKNGRVKLKESEVLEIYKMYKDGKTIAEISSHFNHGGVYEIIKGVNWKHLYHNFI